MQFSSPLLRGTLVRRYKRFFAEIEIADRGIIVAHCPNTGSMKSCAEIGAEVWVQQHQNPKRKLAYTWEFTAVEGGYVGINTLRANHLVAEALEQGGIAQLVGYTRLQRERRYGAASRVDFLLSRLGDKERCWLEVKNATYRVGEVISFPDAVTSRGATHLRELGEKVRQGDRAVLLYVVNRPDGKGFQPLRDLDPHYFDAMLLAREAGVEFLAYRVSTTVSTRGAEIELRNEVPYLAI